MMDWPVFDDALDALYTTFGRYRRPAVVDGCPHCVGADESAPLCTTPLREISCEMISRYAFKAMTTWGTVDDYKYFLPRILELSATDEAALWPGLETWLIASKLELGQWEEWAASEREGIQRFLRARWGALLVRSPDEVGAIEFLKGIVEVDELQPYLDLWDREQSQAAMRQLACAVHDCWGDIAKSHTLWGASKAEATPRLLRNANAVTAWLAAPERRHVLLCAFEQWYGEPWAAELAEAHDELEWLAQATRTS